MPGVGLHTAGTVSKPPENRYKLTGRLVAAILGLVLMIVGVILCLTVIGAILGIPLLIFGFLLMIRGFF